MLRRSFFGRVFGVIGCLFAPHTAQSVAKELVDGLRDGSVVLPDPLAVAQSDKDRNGNCVAQVFRKGTDGYYYHIHRNEVRAGDECIVIGLDGKRLWRVDAYKVHERGYTRMDELEGAYVDGEIKSLLK